MFFTTFLLFTAGKIKRKEGKTILQDRNKKIPEDETKATRNKQKSGRWPP